MDDAVARISLGNKKDKWELLAEMSTSKLRTASETKIEEGVRPAKAPPTVGIRVGWLPELIQVLVRALVYVLGRQCEGWKIRTQRGKLRRRQPPPPSRESGSKRRWGTTAMPTDYLPPTHPTSHPTAHPTSHPTSHPPTLQSPGRDKRRPFVRSFLPVPFLHGFSKAIF
jgi:hypothetical protein